MRIAILTIFLSVFLHYFCFSQVRKVENSIDRAIELLRNDPELKNASISFCVKKLDSNRVVSEFNPNMSLVSASTMKVITTATALELLGSYHKFTTSVAYDGFIDSNCILHGNIYIEGGGDPTLGSKYFEKENFNLLRDWAHAIKEFGIDSINGRVVGDASYFSDEYVPSSWSWGDIGNYYGAGASGLTIYDNLLELEFSSGTGNNDSTWVDCFYPYSPDLIIDNRVKSGNTKKDEAYIYGGPYDPLRIIKGRIPEGQEGFVVKGSIHDPAYIAAFDLESALFEVGVPLKYSATTVRRLRYQDIRFSEDRKIILKHSSPSISQIVYWTNLISNNLYAEHLLRHVGIAQYHDGSVFSSTMAVSKYWADRGVDMTGFYMNDGSGLSRANAVNANQMVDVLIYMKSKSKYAKSFYSSLPIAGKTGTLKSVGRGSKIYNNMRAKSGTMTRVKSYAGYVKSASGDDLVFAIIINNFNCSAIQVKKKLEKVMISLGNYTN